jgi:hypothetical protein
VPGRVPKRFELDKAPTVATPGRGIYSYSPIFHELIHGTVALFLVHQKQDADIGVVVADTRHTNTGESQVEPVGGDVDFIYFHDRFVPCVAIDSDGR